MENTTQITEDLEHQFEGIELDSGVAKCGCENNNDYKSCRHHSDFIEQNI